MCKLKVSFLVFSAFVWKKIQQDTCTDDAKAYRVPSKNTIADLKPKITVPVTINIQRANTTTGYPYSVTSRMET